MSTRPGKPYQAAGRRAGGHGVDLAAWALSAYADWRREAPKPSQPASQPDTSTSSLPVTQNPTARQWPWFFGCPHQNQPWADTQASPARHRFRDALPPVGRKNPGRDYWRNLDDDSRHEDFTLFALLDKPQQDLFSLFFHCFLGHATSADRTRQWPLHFGTCMGWSVRATLRKIFSSLSLNSQPIPGLSNRKTTACTLSSFTPPHFNNHSKITDSKFVFLFSLCIFIYTSGKINSKTKSTAEEKAMTYKKPWQHF